MKSLSLATMLMMSSISVHAECLSELLASNKTIVVLPIYQASVNYLFDDNEKKAMAIVNWNLNKDETITCFDKLSSSNPEYKISIASTRISELEVSVFKGLNSERMIIYPEPGNHFHGETDLIPVDYRAKKEIKRMIENKTPLINISGDFRYSYLNVERVAVAEISCLRGPAIGVLNLHRRLGEIIKELSTRNQSESINKDDVLDLFMTSCVEFKQTDITTIQDLKESFIRKTRLVDGKIPVMGNRSQLKSRPLNPVALQNSTFIEY
jgi:hypothetical protein